MSPGQGQRLPHKWAEGEAAAETIFGSLEDAGIHYIHVTEHKAWQPAFSDSGPSLVSLARRYAPGIAIVANGGLDDPQHAEHVLNDGADIVALGKGTLANPDYPTRLAMNQPLEEFDALLLGPIANIKASELA